MNTTCLSSKKTLVMAVLASNLFSMSTVFAARQVINGADAAISPDGQADGVDFQTDNTLTVTPLQALGEIGNVSAIASGGSSIGTLVFEGVASVKGSITSTGNILNQIDIENTDFLPALVTFEKTARVNDINIKTSDSTLRLEGDTTIENRLNFEADATVELNDGKTIIGHIMTTTNDTGTLTFRGAGTMDGDIGTTGGNVLKIVELTGANTLDTTGNINATDFNFLANGTLNVAADKNINAQVSGPGGGGGTVNYAGNSTTGGVLGNAASLTAVNINAGTLSLGHNINATNTTVVAGAALTPTANNLTVSSDLNLNGTLNLGTNTLNVGGVYNQGANSTLNVTVTGGSTPTAGHIASTGNAAVDATSTVNVAVTGASIPDNSQIQIVSSPGGAGVDVPNVISSTPAYTFSLVTENGIAAGDNLFVLVDRRSFLEADNISTSQVGERLEEIAANPALAPNLDFLVGALNAVPTDAELSNAVGTLVPLEDDSLTAVTQTTIKKGLKPVSNRLENLRLGLANLQSGYSAGDHQEGYGTWVQIYGHDINQDTRQQVAGYDATTGGVALGADREFTPQFKVGLAFNYVYTKVDSNGFGQSALGINTYQGILYGSYSFNNPFYLDAMASVAYNDYNAQRNIIVPAGVGGGGIQASAFADYGAWQYNFATELGYLFEVHDFFLNPKIWFRYSHLDIDEYTEHGAGPLNLKVAYDNMAEMVLGAGLKLSRQFVMKKDLMVIPAFHLGIFHDFENDNQVSTASFLGGGGSFVSPGPKPDDTGYMAGASLQLAKQDALSATFHYDYEWKNDFNVHTAFIKARYEF